MKWLAGWFLESGLAARSVLCCEPKASRVQDDFDSSNMRALSTSKAFHGDL